MPYLQEFLTIALIHLLAAMSPGPDFVLVSRNSLVYSRKSGIYAALGIGLGIGVHVAYSLIGIGFIISKSIVLFSVIKWVGAAYLVYIGYKSLRAKSPATRIQIEEENKTITNLSSLKQGFLTNVLNPKVTLFFFMVFTQVINPATPVYIQLFYGIEMMIMTAVWFTIVAYILSHKALKSPLGRFQHYIEKTMGAVLISLGIKVAISSNR